MPWLLPIGRFRLLLVAAGVAAGALVQLGLLSNQLAAGDPLSQRDEWVQRLREPHTGLVDGMPFRIAVLTVAQSQTQPDRHINLWIDRKVNPDAAVYPGGLGPTRYASLCKVAEAVGCVCFPLDNCILVGRPSWVAELTRTLLMESDSRPSRSQGAPPRRAAIDLQWPSLTTPTEALQILQGQAAKGQLVRRPVNGVVNGQLPHDLWPAVTLRDISPQLVQQLIIGQFMDGSESARLMDPFERSYRFTEMNDAIDEARKMDPNLKASPRGGQVRLLATPSAHQRFCNEILSQPDAKMMQAINNPEGGNALERLQANKRTFIFEAINDPAGKLIKALTAQIGIECEFDADANQELSKLVTFKAVDQTVWQIVRLITDKASLKIQASGDKLRVSVKD